MMRFEILGSTSCQAPGVGKGQGGTGTQAGRRAAQDLADGRGLPSQGCGVVAQTSDRRRTKRGRRGPLGDGARVSRSTSLAARAQLVRELHAANKEAPSSSCPCPILSRRPRRTRREGCPRGNTATRSPGRCYAALTIASVARGTMLKFLTNGARIREGGEAARRRGWDIPQ
jgi:hypothetical protein